MALGTDAYCELSDIQARHQQRTLDGSSKPTSTQVETQITEDFELINGYLDSAGYTIPVAVQAYTQSAKILKKINTELTAAWVEESVYSAGLGGVPEQSVEMRKNAMKMLEQIQKGILSLPDAPKESDGVELLNEHEPDGEFNLDDDGDERDSVFTRTSEW